MGIFVAAPENKNILGATIYLGVPKSTAVGRRNQASNNINKYLFTAHNSIGSVHTGGDSVE